MGNRNRIVRIAALLLALAMVGSCLVSCDRPAHLDPYTPPNLYVKGPIGTLPAFRNALTWPEGPGKARRVERKEMPPEPRYIVAASPGDSLTLTVKGIDRKPKSVSLEVVSADVFHHEGFWEPLYSTTISEVSATKSEITFSWTIPQEGLEPPGARGGSTREYCLRVDIGWESPEIAESAEVEYLSRLTIAAKSLIERAMQIPLKVFRAAWAGDREAVAPLLSDDWFREGSKISDHPGNPFDLRFDAPWDSILWQSDELKFSLVSEPDVYLEYFRDDPVDPFARAEVTYKVKVTDKAGKTGVWDFSEWYGLHLAASEKAVGFMDRQGRMEQLAGGPAPQWGPKVVRDGQVTKIGPFNDLSMPYDLSSWSDDGKYLAFIADESTEDVGIWVVSRDGTDLRRLFTPDKPLVPVAPPYVRLLGWAPSEHKVRFTVSGYQTGPGVEAEDCGVLFGDIDVSTGNVRTFAFIRTQHWRASLSDLNVTQDRTHVSFRDPDDLWRVDLTSGETVKLAEDVREIGFDLFHLRYSPSGWYAVYQTWKEGKSYLVVYDLKTGTRNDILLPGSLTDPSQQRPFFMSWTPHDLIAVSLAEQDHVGHGADSDYPVTSTRLQFYSPDGSLKSEVKYQGKTIGNWAWTADGDMLAYTVGTVSKTGELDRERQEIFDCQMEEIWVQDGAGSAPRRVASLTGQPDELFASMDWVDDDTALEIWFYPPYVNRELDGKGIRVDMDGRVTPLLRPANRVGVSIPAGAIGETTYYTQRTNPEGAGRAFARAFARDIHGNETVVYEGAAWMRNAQVESGVFMVVTTETRWGMLGHEGYIYFHEP